MESERYNLWKSQEESGESSPDQIKEVRYRQIMSEFDNIIKEIKIPGIISFWLCDDYGSQLDNYNKERFEYPRGVYFLINKHDAESIYPSDTACEAYLNILKQLQGARKLRLGEERLPVILKNLELKRQHLHNEAAEYIQKQLSARGIAVDHVTARKLFELLYLIWQHSQGKIFFYGEELDGVDLQKLKERIHDETGAEADISCIVHGFHENNPRRQYNVNLKREDINTKGDTIERIINEMIATSRQAKLKKP